MILRGLMDQSLGGFVCIRGYASLGDLARVSRADLDYQRDLIKTHRDTVITFLRNRKNLFFPEVILSCLLAYDFAKPKAVSGLQPLLNVLSGRGFRSNVDGISVATRRVPFKGAGDRRADAALQIGTINVPDELLTATSQPLFRIDGNHRLSAADTEAAFRDIIAPFCVILFGDSMEDKRNSKTIFHNINSKSIPLTSEENLRIILDDEALFPDELLRDKSNFGWPYLLARKLKGSIEPGTVGALKHVLGDRRAALVDLFKLLIQRGALDESERMLPEVQSCISEVHELYRADEDLANNSSVGLFQAFVYFCLTDAKIGYLKPFQLWVKGNHLTAMRATDADALIEIFERVQTARRRTIFISMQFGTSTDATFKTIEKTVARINSVCRPKIAIEPLRIDKLNKGYSYAITDEILAAIENSGMLIADLTHGNKNVYHEIGYLMGLNRGKHLKQDNFVLIVRDNGKGNVEKDVGFNLKGVSQIRFKEMNELEDELDKVIRKYYGLQPV